MPSMSGFALQADFIRTGTAGEEVLPIETLTRASLAKRINRTAGPQGNWSGTMGGCAGRVLRGTHNRVPWL